MRQRTQQRIETPPTLAAHRMRCPRFSLPVTVLLALVLTATSCGRGTTEDDTFQVMYYTYEVVAAHPHDPLAFTQGLVYHNGFLYEGTGLRGRSELRQVELDTGRVVRSVQLPAQYFGEGITICQDRIIQLTLDTGIGLVYERKTLQKIGEFACQTEGWGITNDGEHLIMSDGSDRLYFLDRDSYEIESYVTVHDEGIPVSGLNELEFIGDRVFANVWPTDSVVVIDPSDGRVTAWICLDGLLESHAPTAHTDVLNGIAYDAERDRLFVTGKFWPLLFEITLVER